MITIAINGFGRIGRTFLRILLTHPEAATHIKVGAINIGRGNIADVPYAIKYDSLMGTFHEECSLQGDTLRVGSHTIKLLATTEVTQLPWQQLSIDWVVEATGKFTKRDLAQQHINQGTKKVLITAPATNEDVSIIPGINDNAYDAQAHTIVSLGSCTTNALVPLLHILDKEFGIEYAMFTTIHSYTNSQVLLDVEAKDLRDSRAAAINIIPSTTGASKMVGKILPQLQGKTAGNSLRVPVAKVSIVDIVAQCRTTATAEQVNAAMLTASRTYLQGIVSTINDPVVSCDMAGNDHSSIVDTALTTVTGSLIKVSGWYDNEWGYACRLRDFLQEVG